MKLTDAQFITLRALVDYGPSEAVEVRQPPAMDGTRKVKLEWNLASARTLAVLEGAGLVTVIRAPMPTPKNAVGKAGKPRRKLIIEATDAGREAVAAG